MTHENAGHYGAKHPGEPIDAAIAEKINQGAKQGRITCAAAHDIARELRIPAQQVGVNIDLLEKRIKQCQLGLFGYRPQRKIIEPAEQVAPQLVEVLERASCERRISCEQCWEIADAFGMKRLLVAQACEKLGLKIKPCQLGAF